jgi:DNA-binding beta-propeller fold protein YncE
MTSEAIIPGAPVADDLEPESPAPSDGDSPEGDNPEGRRRRLLPLLLLLLLAAVTAMFLFLGWYLLFRKPVSELPLPGVTVPVVPHYAYSIYDVVAPTGVAVTADGSRIYATQTEGDRLVIAFDASGKQVATLTPPETGTAGHVPVYVAVNPVGGDVYVSDRPAEAIYVYAADGGYLRKFDPGPTLEHWAPLGLAFDTKGDLYVTNVGAPYQSVVEFGPDGALLRSFGKDGEFNFPNGVAVDSNGNVYVSDSNNGRLVAFDRAGTELGIIRRGVSVGDLGLPRGAAIDDSGRIYVADVSQQGIQSYQAITAGQHQPTFIGGFGEEGTADGAFRLPNAVAVDARARIYVADWRNNRIQVWSY